jgi:hypothetical protein
VTRERRSLGDELHVEEENKVNDVLDRGGRERGKAVIHDSVAGLLS